MPPQFFDIADDADVGVEAHLAATMACDEVRTSTSCA